MTFRVLKNHYRECTLMDNWFERRADEASEFHDYLCSYSRRSPSRSPHEQARLRFQQPVELSIISWHAPLQYDSIICLDSNVLMSPLSDDLTRVTLSIDWSDGSFFSCQGLDDAPATAAVDTTKTSIYRNTFQIRRVNNTTGNNFVSYGDHICLTSTDGCAYLCSELCSIFNRSQSGLQRVTFTGDYKNDCLWQVIPYDPHILMKCIGMPVLCDQPIILAHVLTNRYLGVSNRSLRSPLFGREFEIVAENYLDSFRRPQPWNLWFICGKSDRDR